MKSNFNLRSWCTRFLKKKCDDTERIKIAALVRAEAKKNGFTDDDVDNMYGVINQERANEKEAQKAVTAQEVTKPMETIPEPAKQHTEPQGKRQSNNSGVTVRKSKYSGPSILDMADAKKRGE